MVRRRFSPRTVTPTELLTSETRFVPIDRIASCVGDPKAETVSVYLMIEGSLNGQAVLMLPFASALQLTDLLLGEPHGSSTALNSLQRSVLAEVGNITVSYFLNAMANLTGMELRPSPPAVLRGELGTLLNIVTNSAGNSREQLLIVDTTFEDTEGAVEVRLWVLPDSVPLVDGLPDVEDDDS